MNMKPKLYFQSPVATRSGYGDRAREIARALLELRDEFDIKFISMPWGGCPVDALEYDDPLNHAIKSHITFEQQLPAPDVFIQLSIPNEFMRAGTKYNIGLTAGIETTLCAPEWIEGLNRMDVTYVSSQHAKHVFESCQFEKRNQQTNQAEGVLKLEKPVHVLSEAVDIEVFRKVVNESSVTELLDEVKETFAFLFVGHWLQGDAGSDRKDIARMIQVFCETFKDKAPQNKPALILKTSGATFSIMDREECLDKIRKATAPYGNKAPNVYLIHGDLSNSEMNSLYNHKKVSAMASFTHGEGFGRPLAEFGMTGKPIIVSNWSGHTDFCDDETCFMLPGELKEVPKDARNNWIIDQSQWFTVNYQFAGKLMKHVMDNYKDCLKKSTKQSQRIRANFSYEVLRDKVFTILREVKTKYGAQPIQLQLPKLKKVGEEAPKIQLPKLKKITE
jgi:glycosyltransferase involved in cell wall biosynthesis